MKRYMRWWKCCVGLVAVCCAAACDNSEEAPRADSGARQAVVTLMTSRNGLGDNGYNDGIAAGIFAFAEATGTGVRLLQPENGSEADSLYRKWVADYASADSAVLVLASSAYEPMVRQSPLFLKGKGSRVLLLESDADGLPDAVSTCRIHRYGASYLAGAMSGWFNTVVMAAAPQFRAVDEAIEGYTAGHAAHALPGLVAETLYLADSEAGFAMPDSAYRMAYREFSGEDQQDFMVFPLLGGSGSGLIRYLNDDDFTAAIVIGMDVDQSGYNERIPFSMTVRADKVVRQYLDDWREGKDWPRHRTWGMKDGATEIVLTPQFDLQYILWENEEDYPSDLFVQLMEQYREEALQKEEDYAK